jgi:hypothetical protein
MLGTRDFDLHVQVIDLMKPGREGVLGFFNALLQVTRERFQVDGWNVLLIPHPKDPYAYNFYNTIKDFNNHD